MILVSLLGCGTSFELAEGGDAWSPEPYWTAREVCGLDDGENAPMGQADWELGTLTLSPACAAHLANAIGLDLNDPMVKSVVPDNDADHATFDIVSGLYTILASDSGTVSMLRAENAPVSIRELVGADDAAQSLPAGAFWYWLVDQAVDRVVFQPGDSTWAWWSYDGQNNTIRVHQDLRDFQIALSGEEILSIPIDVLTATTLVHEAAHSFASPHQCGGLCDPDMQGPHGVAAVWLYGWIVGSSEATSQEDCRGAVGHLMDICSFVIEQGFPCGDLPATLLTEECGP